MSRTSSFPEEKTSNTDICDPTALQVKQNRKYIIKGSPDT